MNRGGLRLFRCPHCNFEEAVWGTQVGEFYIYGSDVDYCTNCDRTRNWKDEHTCLDEIILSEARPMKKMDLYNHPEWVAELGKDAHSAEELDTFAMTKGFSGISSEWWRELKVQHYIQG